MNKPCIGTQHKDHDDDVVQHNCQIGCCGDVMWEIMWMDAGGRNTILYTPAMNVQNSSGAMSHKSEGGTARR